MTFLINERKIKPMIFLFVCYNKINKREVGVVAMKRRDKINYYLDMAEVALERSTCIRRNFGAVIVANDEVIATGYNGAPRGRQNCCEMKECIREKLKVPRGERYELCRSVHAEQNAIISAERNKMLGSTLYLCGKTTKMAVIFQTLILVLCVKESLSMQELRIFILGIPKKNIDIF